MLDIIIIGAGGFGRELYEMLWDVYSPQEFRFKGFLAQDKGDLRRWQIDAPILSDPDDYRPQPNDRFLLAIGNMEARTRVTQEIEARDGRFLTFVHPKAHVASTATVMRGAVIYPFATVSNSATLETHVHLNYYASVGHDCRVGRYCLLAPYATLNGFVTLEDEVYISTHGTVTLGRTMKQRSKLSANSACMQDAPAGSFVFGVPGKQVRRMG